MALLDFLKRKKEVEKSKKLEKKADMPAHAGKVSAVKKSEPVKSKNAKFSYEAVKQPHISEKASYLAEKDQYTFEVSPSYNKKEIKDSVEGIYGVDVLSVNIIKIPAKKRR